MHVCCCACSFAIFLTRDFMSEDNQLCSDWRSRSQNFCSCGSQSPLVQIFNQNHPTYATRVADVLFTVENAKTCCDLCGDLVSYSDLKIFSAEAVRSLTCALPSLQGYEFIRDLAFPESAMWFQVRWVLITAWSRLSHFRDDEKLAMKCFFWMFKA